MKTIRIGATVKHIEETDQSVMLFRIQEILSEHRSNLISRILNDLSTYLEFKFYLKVDRQHKDAIRDRLLDLSASKINLDLYGEIVRGIQESDAFHVPTRDFFREIDMLLDSELNPAQLHLIS